MSIPSSEICMDIWSRLAQLSVSKSSSKALQAGLFTPLSEFKKMFSHCRFGRRSFDLPMKAAKKANIKTREETSYVHNYCSKSNPNGAKGHPNEWWSVDRSGLACSDFSFRRFHETDTSC